MKKILFCISDFKQGGIPRCLQSILMNIDTNKYAVDLVCFNQKGPYKHEMPNCNIIKEDTILRLLMVHTKKINALNFISNIPAIAVKIWRILALKICGSDLIERRIDKIANRISSNKYDASIAYAEGYPAYLVRQLNSQKKLVWIHNDYKWIPPSNQILKLTKFEDFDKVCCVSKSTQESFISNFPNLTDRSTSIYNYTNERFIIERSTEPMDDNAFKTDCFTIVSIGRICWQKHFDAIPKIADGIRHKNLKFKWYIIGNGPEDEVKLVKDEITKYKIEDNVILLGNKDNPYKYLKSADLFVLTSRYESYPTVINEALTLGIPIVAADIPPTKEMLKDYNSIIVSTDKMSEIIASLIEDKILLDKLSHIKFINQNEEISKELDTLFSN